MNSGEMMVLCGLAGWFASPMVLAYTLLMGIAFHVFVLIHEEPTNLKRFGQDYAQYCREVNRWLPIPKSGRLNVSRRD
jgi:protein-S-isoprenylcysteine O-methyltransferase Ste14